MDEGAIYRRHATTEAKRRIGYVLQQKLEEELETAGAKIHAPHRAAFYLTSTLLDEELLGRWPSLCIIEQLAPARTIEDISRKGSEVAKEVILPLRVRIAFQAPSSFTPATEIGVEQTLARWLEHQAELVAAAVIDVVLQFAPNNYAVQHAKVAADLSQSGKLDEAAQIDVGGAIIDFEIYQTVIDRAPAVGTDDAI